jgi:N6-adenosine-specific RNA methylase IME4
MSGAQPLTPAEWASIDADWRAMRPAGGFGLIHVDFPWPWAAYSTKGYGKSPERHYRTLPIDDIKRLPLRLLAGDNCAVGLWVTWPLMMHWAEVLSALGLTYRGLLWEWVKFNPATGKYAFGGGYGTRKNLEPLILAAYGQPRIKAAPPAGALPGLHPEGEGDGARSVRDWLIEHPGEMLRSPRREHSRKPDETYQRLETLFHGPYCDLFGRAERTGWTVWGDQLGLFESDADALAQAGEGAA